MLWLFNITVDNVSLSYGKYLEWQIGFNDLGQWFLNLGSFLEILVTEPKHEPFWISVCTGGQKPVF